MRGGEDTAVEAELSLLRSHGHEVKLLEKTNADIHDPRSVLEAGAGTIYSQASWRTVRSAIAGFRPDVMHVHNFFPLWSPSVYAAAARSRTAVVQTLHNFRLICPNGFLLRDGKPCDLCVGRKLPIPAIEHRCYRDSIPATALLAGMIGFHHLRNTWERSVHRYIAVNGYMREQYIRGGFPAARITVKPNLAADPGPPGPATTVRRPYALFVGRLSAEKGIGPLASEWIRRKTPIPLKVAGDGPLLDKIRADAKGSEHVEILGWRDPGEISELLRGARVLVVPSVWNEYPLVAIESFAHGVPVIASRNEAMAEPVRSGAVFLSDDREPGTLVALAETLWNDPAKLQVAGTAARRRYEQAHMPGRNYELLMGIYEDARREAAS